jgi:Na+/phosphate symporter
MDLKQIFGSLFTLIGAAILIYAVLIVLGGTKTFFGLEAEGWKAFVVGLLGLIFFSTGINLIKHHNPRH